MMEATAKGHVAAVNTTNSAKVRATEATSNVRATEVRPTEAATTEVATATAEVTATTTAASECAGGGESKSCGKDCRESEFLCHDIHPSVRVCRSDG